MDAPAGGAVVLGRSLSRWVGHTDGQSGQLVLGDRLLQDPLCPMQQVGRYQHREVATEARNGLIRGNIGRYTLTREKPYEGFRGESIRKRIDIDPIDVAHTSRSLPDRLQSIYQHGAVVGNFRSRPRRRNV